MPKIKIFDILPPEEVKEQPAFLKKIEKPAKKPTPKKTSRFWRGPLLVIGSLVLIAVFCYLFIKPKVEIEIWPEIQSTSFETQVTVLSEIVIPDFSVSQLPGEVIKAENIASQEFSASGTKIKSAKAHGTIRVYNTYSTLAQVFVARTRFVSNEGKLFRAPQRITIPGAHYEGGKLVPGEVDVEVEADQPGQDYNIGPATFSIPGLAGTASYTTIYAKSFEPMTGGAIEETPEVTQADLDKAREVLTEKALEGSKKALENSLPAQDYILVEGARTEEIIDIIPLAKKGQEVDKFLFQVKAEAQALVFKESDLKEFVKSFLKSQIPQDKGWQESSLAIDYSVQSLDLEEGKIVLDLEISAKIYSVIQANTLKETVKNKEPKEIEQIIRNTPGIERLQVKFWPFWAKKSPPDTARIEVKFHVD